MHLPGCLLSISHPKSKSKDTSTSGILISEKHGLILTHSSLLSSVLTPKSEKFLKRDGQINGRSFHFPQAIIQLNPDVAADKRNRLSSNRDTYKTAMLNVTSSTVEEQAIETYTGTVEHIWKAPEFAKAIDKLFPRHENWKFVDEPPSEKTDEKSENESVFDTEKTAFLLPYFVLIKMIDWPMNVINEDPVILPTKSLKKGLDIFAMGTPFGSLSPAVFMNSTSKGIVCNVADPDRALFLTDARCIPGTEGGVVFTQINRKRTIAGMIVAPLCWKANEWIGLTICCSVYDIVQSLCSSVDLNFSMDQLNLITTGNLYSNLDELPHNDVVLVQSGATWGSGVILSNKDTTIVITCSHVVKNNEQVRVRHDFPKPRWYNAEKVYASPTGLAYDIAILLVTDLRSDSYWEDVMYNYTYTPGNDVYMIGHAVFGKERQQTASVSRGVLSKVIKHQGLPVMIQSTCAVHAGASGGPLVSQNGKLIGIVACNAKDTVSGASFPHVNLAIPMQLLCPLIKQYFSTKDKKVFTELTVAESRIQKLWDLQAVHMLSKL